jgi:glutamate-1-semialdehyde 2,1-aminomutase
VYFWKKNGKWIFGRRINGKKRNHGVGGINHDRERVFLISTTHGAEILKLGALVETIKIYKEFDVVGHMWRYEENLTNQANQISKDMRIDKYFYIESTPCFTNYVFRDRTKNILLEFRTLLIQEMLKNGVLIPLISLSYSHGVKKIRTNT